MKRSLLGRMGCRWIEGVISEGVRRQVFELREIGDKEGVHPGNRGFDRYGLHQLALVMVHGFPWLEPAEELGVTAAEAVPFLARHSMGGSMGRSHLGHRLCLPLRFLWRDGFGIQR